MSSISWRLIVRVIAGASLIVSIIWLIIVPGFESLGAVLATLIAFIGLLIVSDTPTISRTSEKTKSAREERNRERMLELVKNSWVKGVLEQSLHGEVLIKLGLEERKDAVYNRQGMELQRPGHPKQMLPQGMKIMNVFDEMGQTLLLLGEPGSGKTTLLLELARDTIARAEEDPKHRIPVVFNLSSWTDANQPITDWLVDELITKYYIPKETAHDWIKNDEMLLLLDGVDEVLPERREACACAINDFRHEHGLAPLVVCCRIKEYETLSTRLDLGGAVSLQPLTEKQVDEYLDRMGQELASLRAALKNDPILYELAQSPLMLSIMTLAYCGMSVHDLQPLETVDARRKHIFDNYVEHMFKPRTERTLPDYHETGSTHDRKRDGERFSKEKTIHWLSWLAQGMSEHGQTVFLIERIQPDWLPTRWQRQIITVGVAVMIGLFAGLFFGLPVGLFFERSAGLFFERSAGLYAGLFFGLPTGLFFGLVGYSEDIRLIETLHFSWSKMRASLWGIGLPVWWFFGLVGLVVGLYTTWSDLWSDLWSAGLVFVLGMELIFVLVGLLSGLVAGLLSGLVESEIVTRTFPNEGMRQSARNALLVGLIFGLSFGLSFGLLFVLGLIFVQPIGVVVKMLFSLIRTLSDMLLFDLIYKLSVRLPYWLFFGLFFGLPTGLIFGLHKGGRACIQHLVLRIMLWRNGSVPLNYVRFLDYAAGRIFLRKVGGGYIFVHRLLLEYFASLEPEERGD